MIIREPNTENSPENIITIFLNGNPIVDLYANTNNLTSNLTLVP